MYDYLISILFNNRAENAKEDGRLQHPEDDASGGRKRQKRIIRK